MDFEFDPRKSAINKTKHGIDFMEAQALWENEKTLILPSLSPKEERFLAIGKIKGKHWTAIFVYRNANIRLISFRRSRKQEVEFYEKNYRH